MSQITTHILDTSLGMPAKAVVVLLEEPTEDGWRELGHGRTDNDGRVKNLLSEDRILSPGNYRLKFFTGDYYKALNLKTFYPSVTIEFEVFDATHYHVPLLLNPFGFSTYRGS